MLKLIAVLLLGVRLAYAQAPMPARLEFYEETAGLSNSANPSSDSGYEMYRTAIVDFDLPESGEVFTETNLVTKVTLGGHVAGLRCTVKYPANVRLKVWVKREGFRVDVSHNAGSPDMLPTLECPRTGGPRPLLGSLTPSIVNLRPVDNSRRDYLVRNTFQKNDFFKYKVTLRLACPVSAERPVPRTINMSPALGQNPWPLVLDNTKTGADILALKANAVGDPLGHQGLTLFTHPPRIFADQEFPAAQFGGGLCFFVTALSITYEPLKMFINSKYTPGSCEYKATEAHETLHYQDYSVLAREEQQQMKVAGESAHLPSRVHPWYVQDEAEAERLVKSVIEQTFKPIILPISARARAETAARDTFANVDAVLRQCLNF